MSKLQAKCLTNALVKAIDEAGEFFETHIANWLDIEIMMGRINIEEAEQDFHFKEVTDTGIVFESDCWEDEYSYGSSTGVKYGATFKIPFGYFDDPSPFLEEARIHRENKEARQQAEAEREKIAHIANLEAALHKARQQAGL